jgi:Trypsin-like peptidase domain
MKNLWSGQYFRGALVPLGLAVILAYPPPSLAQESATRTSSFNETWLSAVVSIEQLKDGKRDAIGTGFLVGTPRQKVALVTAAHVIREKSGILKAGLFYRRTDQLKGDSVSEDSLVSDGAGEWLFSNTHDLACRLIGWPGPQNPPTIPLDTFVEESLLNVGAPLLILGFPTGLRSTTHRYPIARRGMVARHGPEGVTVEGFIFPGNSGGPVVYVPILRLGGGLKSPLLNREGFVGVVSSYIPYQEIAVSPQTGRTRILFEENSGLANIVTGRVVKELIESDEFVRRENSLSK